MNIYTLSKPTTRAELIILRLPTLAAGTYWGMRGGAGGAEAEAPEADTISDSRDHNTSQGYTALLAYRG